MPTVVSKGAGDVRDALVSFKVSPDIVVNAAPDALVIDETGPSMSSWYEWGSPSRGMATYDELVALARATAAEDGASIGRVFLVGHSEGGEAIRTHLIDGADPDGIVVADGTYSPKSDQGPRTQAWADAVARAKGCSLILVASHASLPATLGRSPQETLSLVTGWEMPTSDQMGELATQADGCLVVHSFGGRDGTAHMAQAAEVLPVMIAEARALQSSPGKRWLRFIAGAFAFGAGLVLVHVLGST